ncbi:MAG TPA: carboxymuconolactone decarboxylase family protein [Solirubrobacteraceae bacterium]|nr:carboxymuconolactone decarboxylase family protein [Solirubrobacteraceae bacterium]
MSLRIDLREHAARQCAAMTRLDASVELDPALSELVKVRASQINGCAFCIDMHWKDARAAGESEARLYSLSAWRESPLYDDRERAALALAVASRLEPGT